MIEKKKKCGVEITISERRLTIVVPLFSTMLVVCQEDKRYFIGYLKYIYNKYKVDKSFYVNKSAIKYGEDTIYLGNFSSAKHPKFGNYLEFNKIPIILDLLNCNDVEYSSIMSIIKKIKKIRGIKINGIKL